VYLFTRITQKLHFNITTFDIVMPPARGTYNKIADPALTEDQLSEMDTSKNFGNN
jgi:hypothetical protein